MFYPHNLLPSLTHHLSLTLRTFCLPDTHSLPSSFTVILIIFFFTLTVLYSSISTLHRFNFPTLLSSSLSFLQVLSAQTPWPQNTMYKARQVKSWVYLRLHVELAFIFLSLANSVFNPYSFLTIQNELTVSWLPAMCYSRDLFLLLYFVSSLISLQILSSVAWNIKCASSGLRLL